MVHGGVMMPKKRTGPIAKRRYKKYLKNSPPVIYLAPKEINKDFGFMAWLKGKKYGISRRSRGAKKYSGKGAWRDFFTWKYN